MILSNIIQSFLGHDFDVEPPRPGRACGHSSRRRSDIPARPSRTGGFRRDGQECPSYRKHARPHTLSDAHKRWCLARSVGIPACRDAPNGCLGSTRKANTAGEVAPNPRSRLGLDAPRRPRAPARGTRRTEFIPFYRSAGRGVVSRPFLIRVRFAKDPRIALLR